MFRPEEGKKKQAPTSAGRRVELFFECLQKLGDRNVEFANVSSQRSQTQSVGAMRLVEGYQLGVPSRLSECPGGASSASIERVSKPTQGGHEVAPAELSGQTTVHVQALTARIWPPFATTGTLTKAA